MVARLNSAQREKFLPSLEGWTIDEQRDAIAKQFIFPDFAQAFSFMIKVASLAENADHHPEWSNIYNRVDILLTTHDADGLSMRDIKLAQAIDRLL